MKKITSLCLILFMSALIMSSCKKSEEKTLVKNITYDVLINSDNILSLTSENWWKCNIERSKRAAFINKLFEMIKDTSIKVTDEDGKELYMEDIEKRMVIKDTLFFVRKSEPHDMYDSIVTIVVKPENINMIRFKESWTYDPETYEVTKHIASYGLSFSKKDPYLTRVYHHEPFFWVTCNDEEVSTDPKKVLTERIAYSLPLYENHFLDAYNVVKMEADTGIIREYLKTMWDAAMNGTLKNMKDPDFETLEFTELRADSLKNQITRTMMHVMAGKTTNDTLKDLSEFIINNGKTLYFHERWVLDMKTMSIKKDIQVLSPGINIKVNGLLKGSKYYYSLAFKNKMWQPL